MLGHTQEPGGVPGGDWKTLQALGCRAEAGWQGAHCGLGQSPPGRTGDQERVPPPSSPRGCWLAAPHRGGGRLADGGTQVCSELPARDRPWLCPWAPTPASPCPGRPALPQSLGDGPQCMAAPRRGDSQGAPAFFQNQRLQAPRGEPFSEAWALGDTAQAPRQSQSVSSCTLGVSTRLLPPAGSQ